MPSASASSPRKAPLGKRLERLGRRLLVSLLGLLLGVRRQKVLLPERPAILVVRLDERVGNLLLATPLLESLRARFPAARIELLASTRAQALLTRHPAIDELLPFRKRALLEKDGPLRTPWRLRRRRYDLAIDAGNPTDPSATQAILVRLAGARHTVGVDCGGWGQLYSAPVTIRELEAHEIDLRLALLEPVPGDASSRRLRLGALPPLSPTSATSRVLKELEATPFAVLNIGARLPEKRLAPATYGALAALMRRAGCRALLTYGPSELELARQAQEHEPAALLAPPTDFVELAALMAAARGVITCDTGPMHLAVALGTATCGIFVSTPPSRYAHAEPPHAWVDARTAAPAEWLRAVERWVFEQVAVRPSWTRS